ncbi:MAG: hypothetical protein AAB512_04345 [Patescibacteria group bacterium]
MDERLLRPSTLALQGLILVFSLCLIYFTFVFYPSVVKEKKFAINFKTPFSSKVVAGAETFPVVTSDYKITYSKDSGIYYMLVQGASIDKYVENKAAAQLTLKNSLSSESLCSEKVIYSSASSLDLPEEYKSTSNCN